MKLRTNISSFEQSRQIIQLGLDDHRKIHDLEILVDLFGDFGWLMALKYELLISGSLNLQSYGSDFNKQKETETGQGRESSWLYSPNKNLRFQSPEHSLCILHTFEMIQTSHNQMLTTCISRATVHFQIRRP